MTKGGIGLKSYSPGLFRCPPQGNADLCQVFIEDHLFGSLHDLPPFSGFRLTPE
jgi:hypothetical protein